ncbi:hypothetical protein Neosp_011055 [[Neocosmospora] mangrovei]
MPKARGLARAVPRRIAFGNAFRRFRDARRRRAIIAAMTAAIRHRPGFESDLADPTTNYRS